MNSEQAAAAWNRRFPGVVPTLEDMELFAAGIAVGAASSERRAVVLGDALNAHILALRAAYVDGNLEGLGACMEWICNTLAGPGHLPDLDAAYAEGGAQAMFDRETAEHEAFRAAHPAPAP
jgi:hypothetical protein